MIIENLSEIQDKYEAIFCDLWGCLHNGVRPFPDAVTALQSYRYRTGGSVILLTNAPRARSKVVAQLDALGVPHDAYDDVVTSGDAAQAALASGQFGQRVYHLGPDRDVSFLTEFEAGIQPQSPLVRVPLKDAESIVCTGLFDDTTETPDDYRETILYGVTKKLDLLCANPDVVVDRGDKRIYCAGAIAEAYTKAGGESHYFGKPHPPIYDLARRRLVEKSGQIVSDDRILCIGDGINTDITGALGEGLDVLFVTGGLAAEETGTTTQPEPAALEAYLAARQMTPTANIGFLR